MRAGPSAGRLERGRGVDARERRRGRDGGGPRRVGRDGPDVTESARARSYIFSKQVQKVCQFWLFTLQLLTFWLSTVYLKVVRTLLSGVVHF